MSGVEFAGELAKKGNFYNYELFMDKQKLLECNDINNYEKGITILSNLYARGIKGNTKKNILDEVQQLKKRIKISKDFNKLYKSLRNKNFDLAVLSASPIECSKLIEDYSFDFYIFFELEKEKEVYTGYHKGAMTPTKKSQE